MKIFGITINHEFVATPEQLQLEEHYLSSYKDGTLMWRETGKYNQPKTKKQVKTIFGLMMSSTIEQANDLGIDVSYLLKFLTDDNIPKGQGLTKDFLHELMYIICPTTDGEGRRITLSKMSIEQASNLFEAFRNIVAPLGIVIPDPRPDWKENKIPDKIPAAKE